MSRPISAWLSIPLAIVLASGAALSQQGGGPPPGAPQSETSPAPMDGGRSPMERAMHLGPHGRWWNNPDLVQKLGLTADQQKKMEAIFQQNRPTLLDLSSTVRQEEMAMEPLLAADQPDESKILAQIDRIAQARAQLEKANARMLLGLRTVLTPDQWKTLRADEPRRHFQHFGQGPAPPQ